MVQAYLKHCLSYVVEHCAEDLDFFAQQNDKTLVQRLQVLPCPPPSPPTPPPYPLHSTQTWYRPCIQGVEGRHNSPCFSVASKACQCVLMNRAECTEGRPLALPDLILPVHLPQLVLSHSDTPARCRCCRCCRCLTLC